MRINRGHPLARNLEAAFVPYGTRFVDFANPSRLITLDNSSGDVTPAASQVGGGLVPLYSGDATNDRHTLGTLTSADPVALAGLTTFSVVAVFRWETGAGSFPRIIDKSSAGSGADGWTVYIETSGNDALTFQSPTGARTVTTGTNFVAGSNHTIAFTQNGLVNQWYLDGAALGTTSASLITPSSNSAAAAIGNWNHSTDRMWAGTIEMVLIYPSRALSLQDVQALSMPHTRWDWVAPRRIYIPVGGPAAAGGDVAVEANATAWDWTPLAADVLRTVSVTTNAASWDWTTSAADVARTVSVTANAASWDWTTSTAGVARSVSVTTNAAAWEWTSLKASTGAATVPITFVPRQVPWTRTPPI